MHLKKIFNGFLPLMFIALISSCGNANQSATTPTGVTASPIGSGSVNVSWAAASNASSYIVFYGTNSAITPVAGYFTGQVSSFSTSATVNGLTNGTLYYFIVVAISSTGQSPPSLTASATPSAVSFIPSTVSQGGTAGTVIVSWAAVTGASSYNIYYSQGTDLGTSGTAWPDVSAPDTSATVTGLVSGQTYYFTVTASLASTSSSLVVP